MSSCRKRANVNRRAGKTTLTKDGLTTALLKSRLTSEKFAAVPVEEKFPTWVTNWIAFPSMESSGLRSVVSPAGLASEAVASSAIDMNAPPMPIARAPGLLKLNLNWAKFSVFVCATPEAAMHPSAIRRAIAPAAGIQSVVRIVCSPG